MRSCADGRYHTQEFTRPNESSIRSNSSKGKQSNVLTTIEYNQELHIAKENEVATSRGGKRRRIVEGKGWRRKEQSARCHSRSLYSAVCNWQYGFIHPNCEHMALEELRQPYHSEMVMAMPSIATKRYGTKTPMPFSTPSAKATINTHTNTLKPN